MATDQQTPKNNSGTSLLNPAGAKGQLKDLLHAEPWIETDLINVETESGKAILTGYVYSTTERNHVEAAAWRLPGVTKVVNRITLIKEQQTYNT